MGYGLGRIHGVYGSIGIFLYLRRQVRRSTPHVKLHTSSTRGHNTVIEGYGARSLQMRLLGLLDKRTARAGGNGYETNGFFKVRVVGKRGLLLRRQNQWTLAIKTSQ
jgi:hypothetical protein